MNNKYIFPLIVLVVALSFSSCSKDPDIDNNTMLDGDVIFDPSIHNPELYLVSVAIENPTPEELNTPVVIAPHGYSASTFEWDEFRIYADEKGGLLISQVLLGGHGTTYEDFKNSTWEDWKVPIMQEYLALQEKGYTNINLAGSSTGGTLTLNLIKNGTFLGDGLRNVFLIDPIVIPSDKLLTIIRTVGPMLGYIETEMTNGEEGHWYHYRPHETLQQMMSLLDLVRRDLQKGFRLAAGTKLKVYKSIKDAASDPASAVLIYKGLKNSDGSPIAVEMLDSDLHVVTRLAGREGVTQKDRDMQLYVFDDMYNLLTN